MRAQEAIADSIIVSADRVPDARASSPFAIKAIDAEELKRAPQLRLDDILRAQIPGFSLFRRSSSRVANPTTQGVTLRNFGPSGAGRTLVLLDGIPLNDPFAGYVPWNQIPPAAVGSVIVTPGGGAGLFGNAALAGTIFISSRQIEDTAASAQTFLGNTDTYGATIDATLVEKPVALSFFTEHFSTAGYPVLQANQRGSVDRDADSDSNLIQLGAQFALDSETSLQMQVRGFQEERGNGTIFTHNDTTGADASATITKRFSLLQAELRLAGYYQQRKFRSTFSSINAARDLETPALDQFNVPAEAAGGSVVWTMPVADQHALTLGADTRTVSGQTNEWFRFIGNDFTRLRIAGGDQFFAGIFGEDQWKIAHLLTLVGGVRLDYWQLTDGRRNEFERSTNQPTLSQRFPNRDDLSLNGRLGATANLTEQLSLRTAGYTGFRVPTLNELYRPFRVGNTVTDANAALDPEQLLGGEAGVEWRPLKTMRLGAIVFYNRLENAIGNVTLATNPDSILRQRQNIDLVIAPGFEFSSEWQIAAPFFLRASYLWTEPTVDRASDAALVGRLLAQTPEHTVTVAAEWRPHKRWLLTGQARYSSRQFEDDQNAIALAPFITLDAAIFYEISDKFSAGLKIENLFDTEIENGKSADGLVSIGAPRLVTLQVQYR